MLRTLLCLFLLSSFVVAQEPDIVPVVTQASGLNIVGGSGNKPTEPVLKLRVARLYTIANYKGLVIWEWDSIPTQDRDKNMINGAISLTEITEPAQPKPPAVPVVFVQRSLMLTDLNPNELTWVDLKVGQAVIQGTAVGKVRLIARGGEGAGRRLATKEICIGDVEPPVPPTPPIPPVPPVPPGPTPSPAPIAFDGFRVMFTYDSKVAMTKEQMSVLQGREVREYLNSKCPKEANGGPGYRIYPSTEDTTKDDKIWQDAIKRGAKSQPWMIVSNPQKGGGFEGPIVNVEETMKVLKQFGG